MQEVRNDVVLRRAGFLVAIRGFNTLFGCEFVGQRAQCMRASGSASEGSRRTLR